MALSGRGEETFTAFLGHSDRSMERWAANTIRTLGIVLIAGFVGITSLFLALCSFCAAQGGFGGNKHPEQVVPYAAGAVGVLVVGIFAIGRLARDISRSFALAVADSGGAIPAETIAESFISVPVHLSPLGRKAINRLAMAMAAQIAVSPVFWIVNQLIFWTRPRGLAPHNWTALLLAPFILYHIPYAILIYLLLKRPDRRAFTYSIAVPSVQILQSLFGLSVVVFYYVHQPTGFLLLFLPWAIHIVILVFAYKAIQQVGIHPPPSSIFAAAILTFLYFSFIHVATPFLYFLVPRR